MTSRGGAPHPELGLSEPQPGVPALRVLPSQQDGQAVLTLAGEIDVTTAGVVRAAARNCLRGHPARLSLDLRAVNFCDVAGVRALRQAQREAAATRTEFRIIAPGPMVVRVFILADAGDLVSAVQRPPHRQRAASLRQEYAHAGRRPTEGSIRVSDCGAP